jgi:hypothetical protein
MDRIGRQNGAILHKTGKKRANNPAWATTKYTVLHNQGKRDSMNGQMMESSTDHTKYLHYPGGMTQSVQRLGY